MGATTNRASRSIGIYGTAESAYARQMHTFAAIVIGLVMLATLGVLFAGLITMARGGSGATSNKLMRYRVLLQGAAILLLVIFMSILRS